MDTRATGRSGEAVAEAFLVGLGWQILGRNLHFRFGEVDLLADTGSCVVVVEVKAKKSAAQGYAVEMLTRSKQRTLLQLAKMLQARYNKPVRIDVITIDYFGLPEQKVVHYPAAVGEV